MATVINNPDTSSAESNSGVGIIVGVVLAIVILFLFFSYALPAMRGNNGGTNVNIPEKVDVNVNGSTGQTQ